MIHDGMGQAKSNIQLKNLIHTQILPNHESKGFDMGTASQINIIGDSDSDSPKQIKESRLPAAKAFDVNGSMISRSVSYLGQGFEQKQLDIKLVKKKKYPKPKPKYSIMDEDTYEFNLKYC